MKTNVVRMKTNVGALKRLCELCELGALMRAADNQGGEAPVAPRRLFRHYPLTLSRRKRRLCQSMQRYCRCPVSPAHCIAR